MTTGADYGDTAVIHDFGEANVRSLVNINDVVYFFLINNGNILWRTDGTPEGTFELKDFGKAPIGLLPDINNVAYFISHNNGMLFPGALTAPLTALFS